MSSLFNSNVQICDYQASPYLSASYYEESNSEIEFRQKSYMQFITSLPRTCSPTICGTLNYHTPKQANDTGDNLSDFRFNWSIEQVALLNPCDFSIEKNPSYLAETNKENVCPFEKSNSDFFSQSVIIPSPEFATSSLKIGDHISKVRGSGDLDSPLSMGFFSRGTPSKLSDNSFLGDVYADHEKTRTPLNGSRLKQKKKLFGDESLRCDDNAVAFAYDVSMASNDSYLRSSFTTSKRSPGNLQLLSPIMSQMQEGVSCLSSSRHGCELPIISEESSSNSLVTLDSDDTFADELSGLSGVSGGSGCNSERDLEQKPFRSLFVKTSTPSH